MPEVAVNVDGELAMDQHDVWTSEDLCAVQAVANTELP
jgi:hypothetical protein